VSKNSKTPTGGKGKAKNGLPTCARVVENPERKWRLALSPNETIVVAEDAPPLGMVIQNVGPAVFEVTVENGESVVLMTGKMTVLHAYGKITIENFDKYPGIAEIEFMPRSKNLNEEDIRPQKG
jgi:hypothetical protein